MVDAAAPLRRMTLEEWVGLGEDEPGELVDGVLEEEEVASWAHELTVSWFIRALGAWIVPRGGFVLGSETKLAISPTRGRKPDVIVFLSAASLPARRSSATGVAPDIGIEVVTPTPRDGRRDRVEKKPDYAEFGVRQYWIVDPELQTLEILARGADGRFVELLAASEGTHVVPELEGLALDLDALWAELQRWPDGPG
jgi:Uma2 family endonuclease